MSSAGSHPVYAVVDRIKTDVDVFKINLDEIFSFIGSDVFIVVPYTDLLNGRDEVSLIKEKCDSLAVPMVQFDRSTYVVENVDDFNVSDVSGLLFDIFKHAESIYLDLRLVRIYVFDDGKNLKIGRFYAYGA